MRTPSEADNRIGSQRCR